MIITSFFNLLGKVFLEAISGVSIEKVNLHTTGSDPELGNSFVNFFQAHLFACTVENSRECLQHLIYMLLQPSPKNFDLDAEDLAEILHFKQNGKTVLNWAYQNNERYTVMDLLKLERRIHENEKEGLECLCFGHLGRDSILPWILESYSELYEQSACKRWSTAILTVVIGLMIFSLLPYIFDISSDIDLAISYSNTAFGKETFNMSDLLTCTEKQLSYFCFEQTGFDNSMSYFNNSLENYDTSNSEDVRHIFQVAFFVTMASVFFSGITYVVCIVAELTSDTMSNSVQNSGANQFLKRKACQFWNSKGGQFLKKLVHPCGNNEVCQFLQRKGLQICTILLYILLWPFQLIFAQLSYLASGKNTKYKDQYEKSNQTWNKIKAFEYGMESCIQLIFHLWLLRPFLPTLFTWDSTELWTRCISGIGHFFSFGNIQACYIEKTLGKILMAIISLSLGMAQTKCNKPGLGLGENPLKIVPILLSILAQILGRILAISIIILLTSSIGYYKYAILFGIHCSVILVIQIFIREENKASSDNSKRQRSDNTSNLIPDSCWQCTLNLFSLLISICSSTIVLIDLKEEKRNSSFLSHTLFFLFILVENILMVCLPFMVPASYPPLDCFPLQSRINIVGGVFVLWLAGVAGHIIHYKWAHPMAKLNGPEMSWAGIGKLFHWKKQAPDRYVKPFSNNCFTDIF